MSKKVAIVQSNYIPWKGYFDFINYVDEFILFDDVQYTKRDWRNRNKIKTSNGLHWLTIPVENKNKYLQLIKDTVIADSKWAFKHWNSIKHAYSKTPFFGELEDRIYKMYELASKEQYLSQVNRIFIDGILNILGSSTTITLSSDYGVIDGKNERLIDLCEKSKAETYVSGKAAMNYINKSMFDKSNLSLEWMDYSGYSEYPQLHPPFDHNVSILDLLFNAGNDSNKFMKY